MTRAFVRSIALFGLAACQREAREPAPASDEVAPVQPSPTPSARASAPLPEAGVAVGETGCICDDRQPVCLTDEKRCVQCTATQPGACRGATPTCGLDNQCVAAP